MRFVTLALAALLALVQAELWFGKGGVPHVMALSASLDEQRLRNDGARQRNAQMRAEVLDLKEGLEMVEEKARFELGMVKPDEILVQVSTARGADTLGGNSAFVIALLGAESTGKSTLANALGAALAAREGTPRVAVVSEYLREFCDRHARTPRREEQRQIAQTQTLRIADAARAHDIVVADTTALTIAVYSEQIFDDPSLYADALADHAHADLTLLCAVDLPWQPDGLQRDGPQVQTSVDALLRGALAGAGIAYSVVSGHGPERLAAALAAVQRARNPPRERTHWQWRCERCGDGACERYRLVS